MSDQSPRVMVLLVGEQPAPNLLPLEECNPQHVVLVYSDRTTPTAQRLEPLTERPCMHLVVSAYEPQDVADKVSALVEEQGWTADNLVFNLTGGTKQMVLGAFAVVTQLGCPWVYLVSEKGRSDLHWFQGDALQPTHVTHLEGDVTLDQYLRMYVGAYRHCAPGDALEGVLLAALSPEAWPAGLDEYLTCIRPAGVSNLEMDAVLRVRNQVGVVEIKRKGSKRAIDQLNTAASRPYLGTYARKIMITAQPLEHNTRELAESHHVAVIEVPGYLETEVLSEPDVTHVRQRISSIMGIDGGSA